MSGWIVALILYFLGVFSSATYFTPEELEKIRVEADQGVLTVRTQRFLMNFGNFISSLLWPLGPLYCIYQSIFRRN